MTTLEHPKLLIQAEALQKRVENYNELDLRLSKMQKENKAAFLKLKQTGVKELEQVLDKIESNFPRKPNIILRMTLGSCGFNLRNDEKFSFKLNYEKFKFQMTMLILLLSVANSLFSMQWLDAVQSFLFLYTYSALTLREHILVVNGSNIRSWWIMHHYLAILQAMIFLLWPAKSCFIKFRPVYLLLGSYISAVQLIQFWYQRKRMYTLRAISKIGMMDTTTESASVHLGSLIFLLPFLIIGQLLQLYASVRLWNLSCECAEWHPKVASINLLVIALGNFLTTLATVIHKHQKKKVQ